MEDWPEIETCKSENRRELTIKDCPAKFDKFDGTPPEELYTLHLINVLEISGCEIKSLSNEVSSLKALANLILTRNKLQELPSSICELQSLKVLDVSYNEISSLSTDFGQLTNLQTLNLNSNKLCELPESVANLTLLSSINFSNNNFTQVPEVLLEGKHIHLAEVKASHNEIEDCGDGIGKLQALKTLDLSSNKLKELPQAIANCLKLKHADYKDNPLKDRRLKKLIEQNNSSQKAIMDYIRTKGRPPSDSTGSAPSGGGKGKKKKKGGAKQEVDEDLIKHIIQILKFETVKPADDEAETLEVIVSDEAKDVRPYIVCCIVKRLDLSKESTLKKFLALQTKLHEDVCGKRTLGTIASHDVPSLQNSKLHYDAKEPGTFKVHPLGRSQEVTALQMYKQLKAEADEMKKEKKRGQVSGIYKYLSLLESQEKFAFLSRSSDNVVVSLPPLTNSDVSKIKIGRNDVLLEVTSSQNLGSCKTIMDKLLKAMVDEGMCSAKDRDFYSDSSEEEGAAAKAPVSSTTRLMVQQTRILDSNGKMKVVYPSRTDLEYGDSAIKIERPH